MMRIAFDASPPGVWECEDRVPPLPNLLIPVLLVDEGGAVVALMV